MHKRCLAEINNRSVRAPSFGIAIDQPFSENISTLATVNQSRSIVIGTAENESQKTNYRGLDVVLTIEVRWLWNKGVSAVLWLKVELKLREEYYVSEVMLHVRKELWDWVLDIMQEENTNVRRRGNCSEGDQGN